MPITINGSGTIGGISAGGLPDGVITAADIASGQTFALNGVAFPATQSASADANTLDDYEEGTWTPIDASGANLSFTDNTGTYRKIGNLVIAGYRIVYPSTANGSDAFVGGLPFASGSFSFPTGFTGYGNVGVVINHRLNGSLGSTSFFISNASTGGSVTNSTMSTKQIQGVFIYYTA